MNESFVKAKTIFERMMEDSLARHTSGETRYNTKTTTPNTRI
jgi:hypothetical protein